MSSSYKKVTEYHFEVAAEGFSVGSIWESRDWKEGRFFICAIIEELRKNGQEDTHMFGVIEMDLKSESPQWVWCESEGGSDSFDTYWGPELAPALLEFVNSNEHPELWPYK